MKVCRCLGTPKTKVVVVMNTEQVPVRPEKQERSICKTCGLLWKVLPQGATIE